MASVAAMQQLTAEERREVKAARDARATAVRAELAAGCSPASRHVVLAPAASVTWEGNRWYLDGLRAAKASWKAAVRPEMLWACPVRYLVVRPDCCVHCSTS